MLNQTTTKIAQQYKYISKIFFTFYKSLANIYTNLLHHMHVQTPHLHILTLSHTNTLNHYHFILKPKKTKHTTHPITNFQIILTKI